MDLGTSKIVTMANIVNFSWRQDYSERMGSSAFYIADVEAGPYTKCSTDFFEGGFKTLTNCVGQYLFLYRTGTAINHNN